MRASCSNVFQLDNAALPLCISKIHCCKRIRFSFFIFVFLKRESLISYVFNYLHSDGTLRNRTPFTWLELLLLISTAHTNKKSSANNSPSFYLAKSRNLVFSNMTRVRQRGHFIRFHTKWKNDGFYTTTRWKLLFLSSEIRHFHSIERRQSPRRVERRCGERGLFVRFHTKVWIPKAANHRRRAANSVKISNLDVN